MNPFPLRDAPSVRSAVDEYRAGLAALEGEFEGQQTQLNLLWVIALSGVAIAVGSVAIACAVVPDFLRALRDVLTDVAADAAEFSAALDARFAVLDAKIAALALQK